MSLFFPHRLRSSAHVAVVFLAACAAVAAESTTAERRANRLLSEKSPYLQLHAYNPVDWYPWGEEAFARARAENKPIFLSIGYATCHWCHVMERESFSDPAIAKVLNENFVCIKVDREERPDVDRVYLTFVEASTGASGWPMSVWLTPQLKPFFGGTYFPPETKAGRPGFKDVLHRIAATWVSRRERILQQSDQMLAALAQDTRGASTPDALAIGRWRERGFDASAAAFDSAHGGFESAPKFPHPVTVEFLLDYAARDQDRARAERAQAMALRTLHAIAAGGIRDHLGGGFHRYAVDAQWRVPHFEKMLYDQAQLATVLLSAWQISGDVALKVAAQETLAYVGERLTSEAGGFYSAEAADSPRADGATTVREGAFYLWRAGEIETSLGPESAKVFGFVYGVAPNGNAPVDPEREFEGQNILYRAQSTAEAAARFGQTEAQIGATLDAARARLRAARAKRIRPLRDDKVITAWNGMMISAYARAAQVLEDSNHAAIAVRAAEFARAQLYDPKTGRLSRSYRGGVRDAHGFAEDYAFLVQGLLDLYEATFEVRWLGWAMELQTKQDELFWDKAAGGYFANAADDASILLRLKQDNDGAEPSANSIALRNLARLADMLQREDWRARAARTARAFGATHERAPDAMPQMLASLAWLEGSPKQIVIVGAATSPKARALIRTAWRTPVPGRVLVSVDERSRPFFARQAPFFAELPEEKADAATAYVCANFVCQQPTSEVAMFAQQLRAR